MDELQELYQAIILDHSKKPRNYGHLPYPTFTAQGKNPVCGDAYTVALKVEDNTIQDIKFFGEGCAISKASASLMTRELKGKSLQEAFEILKTLISTLVSPNPPTFEQTTTLGDLAALTGTRNYPDRIHCARLAWDIFIKAIMPKEAEEEEE